MNKTAIFDVVVVGAGVAGLSAALFLTRARRLVLIFDGGPGRIDAVPSIHEYIGYEGLTPVEVKQRGMKEVINYGAEIRSEMVDKINVRADGSFDVHTSKGKVTTRTVVLATGLIDVLPDLPGLQECWGTGVNVCPCFNGYEMRDKRLVAFGLHERLAQSGKFLTAWSSQVTIVTPDNFEPAVNERLRLAGVKVIRDTVARLDRTDNKLSAVVTQGGVVLPCEGVYISAAMKAASPLAESLCDVSEAGFAKTDSNGKTSRPGLWVIGNASDPIGHLVHAAAAGTSAGPWINDYLIERNLI